MAKLIICCKGNPAVRGYKLYEMLWNDERRLYVYQGREFDELEFNDVVEKALDRHKEFHPFVKVVSTSGKAVPQVITVSARQITAEEAEAVLKKLAPERLKKKPGPRVNDEE